MSWQNYINQNRYFECQVIAALNAYFFLNKKTFCSQQTQQYEDLVDLAAARDGASVFIEKVYRKIGIKRVGILKYIWEVENIFSALKLPVAMSVWHKRLGLHRCLIVGQSKKCRAFRIANFSPVTTAEGWVFIEDLYQWVPHTDTGPHFEVLGKTGRKYQKEKKLLKITGRCWPESEG
jgi:hypothetical protein